MTRIKHAVLLMAVIILLLAALPTFAASTYLIDVAVTDCTLTTVVSGPAGTVYLSITGPGLVVPIDDVVTIGVSNDYNINAAPGSLIDVSAYGDAAHTILLAVARTLAPDGCYDPTVIPTPLDCPYPPSPLLGQLQIPGTVETYWAPRLDTATTDPERVIVAPGTSWWVLEARDGFYKIFIACYARYVWVIADQTIPNPQYPWYGAPLPDAGELPE